MKRSQAGGDKVKLIRGITKGGKSTMTLSIKQRQDQKFTNNPIKYSSHNYHYLWSFGTVLVLILYYFKSVKFNW